VLHARANTGIRRNESELSICRSAGHGSKRAGRVNEILGRRGDVVSPIIQSRFNYHTASPLRSVVRLSIRPSVRLISTDAAPCKAFCSDDDAILLPHDVACILSACYRVIS